MPQRSLRFSGGCGMPPPAGKRRANLVSGQTPHRAVVRYPRHAFTLIEVMFALALLSLAVTTFAAMYPASARVQASSRLRAQAVRVAQREMEALRRLPFGTLANLTQLKAAVPAVIEPTAATQPYPFTNLTGDGADSVAALLPGGTGTVEISDVLPANLEATSPAQTNLRRITVTVRWNDRGRTHFVVLRSVLAYLEAPKS